MPKIELEVIKKNDDKNNQELINKLLDEMAQNDSSGDKNQELLNALLNGTNETDQSENKNE